MEEQLVTVEVQPEPAWEIHHPPRSATRLITWLRKVRAWGADIIAGNAVKVPCVVCLKLYTFHVNHELVNEHGLPSRNRWGMFCSQKCMLEYCRIVVKSAKTSQMMNAQRSIWKEVRRRDGHVTLVPVKEATTTIKGRGGKKKNHGTQLPQRGD